MTLNEAITEEETVLAFMVISYNVNEKGLKKINKMIKKGAVDFGYLLDSLIDEDMYRSVDGSPNPPNPEEFTTLRNAFVYNFIVEDYTGKQYPMQIYVEYFTSAESL